jgi:hypothetical protein
MLYLFLIPMTVVAKKWWEPDHGTDCDGFSVRFSSYYVVAGKEINLFQLYLSSPFLPHPTMSEMKELQNNQVQIEGASDKKSIDAPFSCPPSLLNHLQEKLNNIPWTASSVVSQPTHSHSKRLLDELFTLAMQTYTSDKAIRKCLYETSEKVLKTLQCNDRLRVSYEQSQVHITEMVDTHDHLRQQNKRIFNEITQHHESLVADGYDTGVTVDSSLKKYKNAANEMGKVS